MSQEMNDIIATNVHPVRMSKLFPSMVLNMPMDLVSVTYKENWESSRNGLTELFVGWTCKRNLKKLIFNRIIKFIKKHSRPTTYLCKTFIRKERQSSGFPMQKTEKLQKCWNWTYHFPVCQSELQSLNVVARVSRTITIVKAATYNTNKYSKNLWDGPCLHNITFCCVSLHYRHFN